MNSNTFSFVFFALLTCFAPRPGVQAAVPAPDGGYPGFHTAEGQNALVDASRRKAFRRACRWNLDSILEAERAIHQFAVSLLLYAFHHSLKSPLCLWELDILWQSVRKLPTYEEIHTVFTRHLRCDGVYRFLSAGGNDRYWRTRSRANHVYESSFAVTDALA